ncbi:MAG: hypothetical protein V9E90_15780 [Saprospiraceae bacterium]
MKQKKIDFLKWIDRECILKITLNLSKQIGVVKTSFKNNNYNQ